jgi:hypothetical protein
VSPSCHPIAGIRARLIALLLAALWFPASSHAWLECTGFIHSAQDGHQETTHEAANGHCEFEPAQLTTQAPALSTAPWLALAVDDSWGLLPSRSPVRLIPCPGTAPPELTRTWHFIERMALPGRAPSLATR